MFPSILVILAAALLAPWVHRVFRPYTGWFLALFPAGIFLYLVRLFPQVTSGQVFNVSYPWVPTLGVSLSFSLDGLSLLFALLIIGIGALILVYAGGYLKGHVQQGRFFAFLLLFMAAMLGVVLADNVLTLFVFWELTSISSYLLIGFNHDKEASRNGALQALLVTGLGGLALLAGLVLLHQVTGTWELHLMKAHAAAVVEHPYYIAILVLVLLGAFTKSAQFPFHFWLPNAMEAPTPVSAYLHSATMVKAGVYLLARFTPVLGGTVLWQGLLMGFGGATMLVGAYLALQHTDLKRLLAYSTISALGIMIFLIGTSQENFATAAVLFIVAHALYKGALFMMAGTVDHETGTRDVLQLGGLFKAMPVTAVAGLVAAISMAGIPPLLGFVAKEMFYETAQGFSTWAWIALSVFSSVLLVVVAGMVAIEPFFGKLKTTPKQAHEGPISLWLGPVVLGIASLGFGLFPTWLGATLLSSAATALQGSLASVKLVLWHGFNFTLALSALTLTLGILLYLLRQPLRTLLGKLKWFNRWGPEAWYDFALVTLKVVASGQTKILQNGYLRNYILVVLLTVVGLVGGTLLTQVSDILPPWTENVYPYEVMLMILIMLAALMATFSQSRLGAMAGLGVVGFGVALAFILYGAPDLAMTQILVETLVVILLVLGFHHMPGFAFLSKKSGLIRDAIIALSVGTLMTLLVLASIQVRFTPTISDYYAKNSLPLAHGRNVVNVILVDFRALDTLGEIIVLTLAGLGAFALLKLRSKTKTGGSS